MIAAYVGNNPKHWDKYLPVFCFALNSADHESSGVTSTEMNLGQESLSISAKLNHFLSVAF